MHQKEMKSQKVASYVGKITFLGHCCEESRIKRPRIDLSDVLSDASSLDAMIKDLFLPFEAAMVDQIVAITPKWISSQKQKETQEEKNRFTSTIAAAMAGVKGLGYCESIVRISPDISPKSKKNRKTSAELDRSCQRFISLQAGHNKHVELKKTWIRQGQRVLLFIDWIDTIEPILAVRDVIRHIGGEVIGVAFVICTNPTLLKELKAYEIPFSFSWVPSSGGELTMDNSHTGVTCKSSGTSTSKSLSHKRKREQTGTSRQVFHVTTHYEANAPGEDRSVNITKPNDEDVKIFGVFDGHGGNIAVNHLKHTLCQEILANVSSNATIEANISAVKEAFARTEEQLKQHLIALPASKRIAKGICNTGSCAAIALLINSTLIVANVGDCAIVMGKKKSMEDTAGTCNSSCTSSSSQSTSPSSSQEEKLQAIVLTQTHNCENEEEAQAVIRRSRDRNPIRLSKMDQARSDRIHASGNGQLCAIRRVAGSLAVTRAFGDFYLKSPEMSLPPFKNKLPYITAEPYIQVFELDGHEEFLILASDGIWEVLTPEEAIEITQKYNTEQNIFFSNVSAALVHAALEKCARQEGLMLYELLNATKGSRRRELHDDITCSVVRFI